MLSTCWFYIKLYLQCPLPEIAALANRQEAILKQLAQLKKQMTALREELKKSESNSEKLNIPSINSQVITIFIMIQYNCIVTNYKKNIYFLAYISSRYCN